MTANAIRTGFTCKLRAMFAAALVILLAIVLSSLWTTHARLQSERRLIQTHRNIVTLLSLAGAAATYAAEGRTYALSGDATALQRTAEARARIRGGIETLREALAQDAVQMEALDALRGDLDGLYGYADRVVAAMTSAGAPAAVRLAQSGEGSWRIADVRNSLDYMRIRMDVELEDRSADNERNELHALLARGAMTAALIATLLLSYLALRRELRRRTRASAALAVSEAALRANFEQAGVGIAHIGTDRRILRANRKLGLMLGRTAAGLAGKVMVELSHPGDRESLTAARDRLYAGDVEQAAGEKRFMRSDGETLWARVTVSLARDASGAPEYEIAVFEDITRERRAWSKMNRFRAALDMSFDAVYVVSRSDMTIVNTNEAACRMLGYTREELIGADPRMVFADTTLTIEQLAADYDQALARPNSHETVETLYRRKDGTPVPVEVQRGSAVVKDRPYLIAVARDISARRAANRALRESEERYRRLVEVSPDAIYVVQEDRIAFANAAAARMFGAQNSSNLIGRPVLELTHPDFRAMTQARLGALRDGTAANPRLEQVFLRQDGSPVEVEVASARFSFNGAFAAQVVARDVTERKSAERLLALEHAVTRCLAEADGSASGLKDVLRVICETQDWETGRFFTVDEEAGLLRYKESWGKPGPDNDLFLAMSPGLTFARGAGLAGRVWESGEPIWVPDVRRDPRVINLTLATQSNIRSAFVFPVTSQGQTIGVMATFSREIREPDERLLQAVRVIGSQLGQYLQRKQAEQHLAHLAQFDALTGLPNRALFRDRLDQALLQARRNTWLVGVLMLDLDHFKRVNDTLGHGPGDELLRQVGARLHGCLRAGDTVARLGGDEFALVLPELESPEAARVVCDKLLEALKAPVDLGGHEIFMSASIGIAIYPPDGPDADTLLRGADTAMYGAKQAGRNGWKFFTQEMNAESSRRLDLEKDLRYALERGEFELHYQPKAEVSGARVTGAEALLRWRRADGSLVSPAEFIPILEDTGLIVEVGDWVIREACRQHAAWEREGVHGLCVSVNVSARQFHHGQLVESVREALAGSGCAPQCLELEITESLVMHDVEVTIETLDKLRAMGVRVSVDDFGTGYSSLAYLKRLPIDVLKIDRSFVKDLSEDPNDAAIVTAIIAMARSLGYRVIAEGVETQIQRQFLEAYGCHEIQGYLLSRPLPADKLAAWLDGRQRADCPEKLAA